MFAPLVLALIGQPTLLQDARAAYESLDYSAVVPLAERALASGELDVEQQVEAHVLRGSSLVIMEDLVEAESSFRLVLRTRPDFSLPDDVSPKIIAVFSKVQAEEKALSEKMRAIERSEIVATLKLSGDPPENSTGGRPLLFVHRLTDPRGVVAQLRLHYRRQDQPAYSILPLDRDPSGVWSGAIPASSTANDDGFALQYFLDVLRADGETLTTFASAESPLELHVSPGNIEDDTPLYERVWFWSAAFAVAILSSIAGVLAYDQATSLPEGDLDSIDFRN